MIPDKRRFGNIHVDDILNIVQSNKRTIVVESESSQIESLKKEQSTMSCTMRLFPFESCSSSYELHQHTYIHIYRFKLLTSNSRQLYSVCRSSQLRLSAKFTYIHIPTYIGLFVFVNNDRFA